MKKILFSILALVAIAATAGAQNKINGHEYVDLGLPSGLLWATCNVGATKPEDYGDYFAWGETTTKEKYSWDTYKWGTKDALTKYTDSDGKRELDSDDDAAAVNWKGGWRMPTKEEFQELISNATREWTTVNGVNGCKLTSKTNGKSIFLPAAGGYTGQNSPEELFGEGEMCRYWSSSLNDENKPNLAFIRSISTSTYSSGGAPGIYDRRYGMSVRPVINTKDLMKIEAQCQPAEGGTVEGTGFYAVGSKATLTAKPNKGYKFVKWTTLSGAWQGAETTLTVNVNWWATGGNTWIAVFEKDETAGKVLAVTFTKAVTPVSELDAQDRLALSAVTTLVEKGKLEGYSLVVDSRRGTTTLKKGTKTLFVVATTNGTITVSKGVTSDDNINVELDRDLIRVLSQALGTTEGQILSGFDAIQVKFDIDTTTAIDAPLNDNGEMTNDSWYTLDGVKLSGEPTRKGVYIRNGKKVVK